MPTARFEFDRDLSDLLPVRFRDHVVTVEFEGPQSAKHLIEALGIPHTEVGSLQVNGAQSTIGHLVRAGDRIAVGGMEPAESAQPPRFLLDGHLGQLASGLRMLGLDTLYDRQADDRSLVREATQTGRVILTRDRRMLMRKAVMAGYLVRSMEPDDQLLEVCRRFCLTPWWSPFKRCIRCNGVLQTVDKRAIWDRLLPLTRRYYNQFRICRDCQQAYWEGSHLPAMEAKIARLRRVLGKSENHR